MTDVKTSESAAASEGAGDDPDRSDAIKRKRRKLKAGPAWHWSDLGAIASLVLLLAPAWLLPERWWGPLCRARVESLLSRIHPRYADAIRLRVLEERPRQEAALALGVAVGTFDVVLHRAMVALRKVLNEEP